MWTEGERSVDFLCFSGASKSKYSSPSYPQRVSPETIKNISCRRSTAFPTSLNSDSEPELSLEDNMASSGASSSCCSESEAEIEVIDNNKGIDSQLWID
jgi:hypothetical protein